MREFIITDVNEITSQVVTNNLYELHLPILVNLTIS